MFKTKCSKPNKIHSQYKRCSLPTDCPSPAVDTRSAVSICSNHSRCCPNRIRATEQPVRAAAQHRPLATAATWKCHRGTAGALACSVGTAPVRWATGRQCFVQNNFWSSPRSTVGTTEYKQHKHIEFSHRFQANAAYFECDNYNLKQIYIFLIFFCFILDKWFRKITKY